MRTQRSRLRNNPKPHPNRISGWPLCPSLLRRREGKKGGRGGGGRGEEEGGEDELCGVCWPPRAKSGEEVSGALSSALGRQGCRG